MPEIRAAFYGDDFTGSVDALLQFARRGWSGRLFTTLPTPEALHAAAQAVDVVGIAGIARSLSPEQMDAEVIPALRALVATGAPIVQYKACSTADSAPEVGSLGRVIELGREIVAPHPVPMLFAQPDFGRFTLFGTHFASEDGVVHRLDRQPTMSSHPSTPMTEADLAIHIGRQTALPIGAVSLTVYADLAERLRHADAAGVVLDAVTDADLVTVGAALRDLPVPVFAIGSGGLSQGIAAAAPGTSAPVPVATPAAGAVLVVSGSRSPQTRRQAEAAAAAGWLVQPLPLDVADAAEAAQDAVVALSSGRGVVFTSADADASGAGERPILEAIAEASAIIVKAAAQARAARRVIVCGGDTSSRITRLLGIEALSIAANPWGNVVLLRPHATDPAIDGLELLLKGGQVGADTLFLDVEALDA
ncbi:four-carbon acid sugar kinase family protein [Microbacterium sp. A8/3-1]|uniref:Four-carbon acid sugar kinase family protein n=1 Tax=Microbacterium sp. A8/3-1 TaxID=3160749 RepID=A0AAU7VQT1_9MICO